MSRRLLALLMVLLLYVLIGGLLAEGVVRVFRVAPPAASPGYFWQTNHPITGWTLQPGAEGRWFNPMYEYDQYIRINSQGLRSPDVCVPVSSDSVCDTEYTYRILVLGDSYIEALHVPLEATFGQQLAQTLAATLPADGQRIEVINVGVSGWGTDQQLLWLREEGPRYAPDLILLAFYPGNDFMNNHMALEYANFGGVRKPWFTLENDTLTLHDAPYSSEQARLSAEHFRNLLPQIVPPDPATINTGATSAPSTAPPTAPLTPWLRPVGEGLHRVSALYRYVEPRIRVAAPNFAAALARIGLIAPGQETSDQAMGATYIPVTYGVYQTGDTLPAAPFWQEAFALTGALFQELRAEADTLGADVAAVVLTAPEQVNPARWQEELNRYPAMQEHEWVLEQPTRTAMNLLAEAEIPALNLLPLFREAAGRGATLHFSDDGHWTAGGHAFAGELAANFLMIQGFTSPAPGVTMTVEIPRGAPHIVTWLLWIVVAILVISIVWSAYKAGPRAWSRGAWAGLGTTGELLAFTIRRGQYVFLPLLVILILFGGLLLIAQSSVVGPFIYPLF